MAPLSIRSGVRFAKTVLPETLRRSVSTVQSAVSRHILPSAQPRSFTVCTHVQRRRRGLVASSLDELLEQAARTFVLSCRFLSVVLEEDGTLVDSEEFFQSLPSNTPLMVLEEGEMWTQNKVLRQPKRSGIAKLTFDLYKRHPEDFLCCLAIRLAVCGSYTLSYDLRCSSTKHILRSLLHCLTHLSSLTGRLLLCTSASLLRLTADEHC